MSLINKKICVVGLGYIGLPTALILRENGYDVVGVDNNEDYLEKIQNLSLKFDEKSLDRLFKKYFTKNLLEISNIPIPSDIYLICVPTPIQCNNKPDLKFVYTAINSISPLL